MQRLPGLLLLGLAGCSCGSFTARTGGLAFDGQSLDRDDYIEECGADLGTTGDIDLMGDGQVWLDFGPGHPDEDIDWLAISLDLFVSFPNVELVEGAHVDDVTGTAMVSDMSGNHYAVAELTRGSFDVVSVGEPDPVCAPFRAQEFELAWDVAWGAEGDEYRYTAVGQDRVSLFLDQSSSDEACL